MNPAGERVPRWLLPAALAASALVAFALWRGGLLGLPPVPTGLSAERSGLADLAGLRERAAQLDRAEPLDPGVDSALALARRGLAAVRRGDSARGLDTLRAAFRLGPRDLVIGNAYRMAALRVRRAILARTPAHDSLPGSGADELAFSAIAPLQTICREQPSREATLQLALAWVDELILHPALEVQAPASIESVNQFTTLLAEDPVYVPALLGRGLNYLHRPARLVWPELRKAAPDAASRDLGTGVAIGRRIGGAPPRLVATLALDLGDAYAKEGRAERARSWWQIAQNASPDADLRAAVRRRFGWRDEELLDRLEEDLARGMLDLDHPLSDLSVMWR